MRFKELSWAFRESSLKRRRNLGCQRAGVTELYANKGIAPVREP
jgi:hypothetical protein